VAVKSLIGMPPRESRNADGGCTLAIGDALLSGACANCGWVSGACAIEAPRGSNVDADGGPRYALVPVELVGGGGTRVAPVIGPSGISGEEPTGAMVLAGIAVVPNGDEGMPPLIDRWHPAEAEAAVTRKMRTVI